LGALRPRQVALHGQRFSPCNAQLALPDLTDSDVASAHHACFVVATYQHRFSNVSDYHSGTIFEFCHLYNKRTIFDLIFLIFLFFQLQNDHSVLVDGRLSCSRCFIFFHPLASLFHRVVTSFFPIGCDITDHHQPLCSRAPSLRRRACLT
jgi:hypothetical protein